MDISKSKPFYLLTHLVILGVITFIALSAYSPESSAKPAIKWTPRSIEQTLALGETDVVTVSFTPRTGLTNTKITVVPELQPFVTVTPTSFNILNKGTTYTVDVTFFSYSDSKKGVYDGTIHMRNGSSTVAKPFPIIINNGIPPDPGEEGKQTLEGVDSDNDGVRDDIQRYIILTYPNSAKVREALFQYAKSLQTSILESESEERSLENAQNNDLALICLRTMVDSAGQKRGEMRAEFLNTEERLEAFLVYSDHSGGKVFSIPFHLGETACDFDVSEMES